MSFTRPRTKIIAIMKSLGYNQVETAFDYENVADNILNKSFHVEQNTITPVEFDQQTTKFDNRLTIRFWHKAKRKSSDLMTDSLISLDTILNSALTIANRVDGFVDVKIGEVSFLPHSFDNDEIVRVEIALTYEQICAFGGN